MPKTTKTNKAKTLYISDFLHEVANQAVRLGRAECDGEEVDTDPAQINPVPLSDHCKSPFICDAVGRTAGCIAQDFEYFDYVDTDHIRFKIKERIIGILLKEGMPGTAFKVFGETEPQMRQIHRWTFLMLLAEKYEGETITL